MQIIEQAQIELNAGKLSYGEFRNRLRKAAKQQKQQREKEKPKNGAENQKHIERLHVIHGCPICHDPEGSDTDCPNGCFDFD